MMLKMQVIRVYVQLSTSADNVALSAFAAVRCAAASLLLTTGPSAMDQHLLHARPTTAKLQQWCVAPG